MTVSPTPSSLLPAAFPSLSQTKCGGNKCALLPRVTGRSRLKIQFATARFERRVSILYPGAALQLQLHLAAAEEEAGQGDLGEGEGCFLSRVSREPTRCTFWCQRTSFSDSEEAPVISSDPQSSVSIQWKPLSGHVLRHLKKKSSGWNYFPLCETPGWLRGLENVRIS